MKYALTYIFSLIITFFSTPLLSQELSVVKKTDGKYYEEYEVLKSDTIIKHGGYHKMYRNEVIEKGQFTNNIKSGKWLYFSLDAIFEYEYDYDTKRITKISGNHNEKDYMQTPVFFDGSPIIPYLYLIQNISYPIEAKKYNINGRVSLCLQIDNKGEIKSLYLKEKLHPLLDKEVIDEAKNFPSNWKWIPATFKGNNTEGEYVINIEFELTD